MKIVGPLSVVITVQGIESILNSKDDKNSERQDKARHLVKQLKLPARLHSVPKPLDNDSNPLYI
ncbi:uncharacterized protein Dwil_GK27961 [Drosophila willistoni]|nr:uncharacterized protein Dwil_GK27961 [Drosophila willistoni]